MCTLFLLEEGDGIFAQHVVVSIVGSRFSYPVVDLTATMLATTIADLLLVR